MDSETYYLISNSTNLKEVGYYIQCKGIPERFKGDVDFFNLPNSMTLLSNDHYPEEQPNLIFELEDEAILTDVISTSNISAKGLLINQKTKDLLANCKLADHKFFPAVVIKNNSEYQYYWLHFVKNDWHGIDLQKSILYSSKNGLFRTDYVFPKSFKEADKLVTKENLIFFEKICLESEFAEKSGDLFFLPIPWKIFASELLKKNLEKNNISGIEYFPKLNKWIKN